MEAQVSAREDDFHRTVVQYETLARDTVQLEVAQQRNVLNSELQSSQADMVRQTEAQNNQLQHEIAGVDATRQSLVVSQQQINQAVQAEAQEFAQARQRLAQAEQRMVSQELAARAQHEQDLANARAQAQVTANQETAQEIESLRQQVQEQVRATIALTTDANNHVAYVEAQARQAQLDMHAQAQTEIASVRATQQAHIDQYDAAQQQHHISVQAHIGAVTADAQLQQGELSAQIAHQQQVIDNQAATNATSEQQRLLIVQQTLDAETEHQNRISLLEDQLKIARNLIATARSGYVTPQPTAVTNDETNFNGHRLAIPGSGHSSTLNTSPQRISGNSTPNPTGLSIFRQQAREPANWGETYAPLQAANTFSMATPTQTIAGPRGPALIAGVAQPSASFLPALPPMPTPQMVFAKAPADVIVGQQYSPDQGGNLPLQRGLFASSGSTIQQTTGALAGSGDPAYTPLAGFQLVPIGQQPPPPGGNLPPGGGKGDDNRKPPHKEPPEPPDNGGGGGGGPGGGGDGGPGAPGGGGGGRGGGGGPGGPGGHGPGNPAGDQSAKNDAKEANWIKFESYPTAKQVRAWKLNFKKKIAGASFHPHQAFAWISEIETMTYDEIVAIDKVSNAFITLNAKIGTGLSEIFLPNYRFNMQINMIETKMELTNEMMTGRAMARAMHDWFKLDEVDGAMLDFSDLLKVKLQGDDLEKFINSWEMTLAGTKEIPLDEYMEGLVRDQLTNSSRFNKTLEMYDHDHNVQRERSNYEGPMKLLKLYINTNRHNQNRRDFGANHKAHALAVYDAQQGDCHQWIRSGGRDCVRRARGEDCPYNHPDVAQFDPPKGKGKKGKTPGGKPTADAAAQAKAKAAVKAKQDATGKGGGKAAAKAAPAGGKPPNKDAQGRQRGKSPLGDFNRLACPFYMKGACNKGKACGDWHPDVCKGYKAGTCAFGTGCRYLHADQALAATGAAGAAQAPRGRSPGTKKKEKAARKAAKEAGTDKSRPTSPANHNLAIAIDDDSLPFWFLVDDDVAASPKGDALTDLPLQFMAIALGTTNEELPQDRKIPHSSLTDAETDNEEDSLQGRETPHDTDEDIGYACMGNAQPRVKLDEHSM